MTDLTNAIEQVRGATQDLKELNDSLDREQEERDRMASKHPPERYEPEALQPEPAR